MDGDERLYIQFKSNRTCSPPVPVEKVKDGFFPISGVFFAIA